MKEQWLNIHNTEIDDQGAIAGDACADAASPWFSGHFPGEPVLPGIGQISLIHNIINHHARSQEGLWISEISKVRFRRIVRPGETMSVQIAPDPKRDGAYKFRISVNGELACNGNFTASAGSHGMK